MDAQKVYWNSMVQWKYELLCLEEMYRKNVKRYRLSKILVALISSAAVATWAVWSTYPMLWASIVAFGQVVSVINEYVPYHERITNFTKITDDMEKIFADVETTWYDVACGNLTVDEVYAKAGEYKQLWRKAQDGHFANDYVVVSKRVCALADKMTNDYFKNMYGGGE